MPSRMHALSLSQTNMLTQVASKTNTILSSFAYSHSYTKISIGGESFLHHQYYISIIHIKHKIQYNNYITMTKFLVK